MLSEGKSSIDSELLPIWIVQSASQDLVCPESETLFLFDILKSTLHFMLSKKLIQSNLIIDEIMNSDDSGSVKKLLESGKRQKNGHIA